MRCLDNDPIMRKGSYIFTLCQKVIPLFKAELTWIPGNGKQIKIWKDSIMGNSSLAAAPGIQNF